MCTGTFRGGRGSRVHRCDAMKDTPGARVEDSSSCTPNCPWKLLVSADRQKDRMTYLSKSQTKNFHVNVKFFIVANVIAQDIAEAQK